MRQGYMALMAAIIISLVLLAVTFSLSFAGYFGRFNLLEIEYKEKSLGLAEACVDVALLKLVQTPSYLGNETVPLGSDSCFINPVLIASGQITLKVKAVFRNTVTNLKVMANSADLTLISWEEVPSL